MSARNLPHLAKRMRWAARVIGLIISEFLAQGFVTTSVEGGLLVVIGLAALAGCVMSWWRDIPASILLVATSAGLAVHIGIFAGRNHFLAWSMLGLPYLVAGVLLINAWRLSKHKG